MNEVQRAIVEKLGVKPMGKSPREYGEVTTTRIEFLQKALIDSGTRTLVLGISGGVDSLTAGRLAQLACEENRSQGYDCSFIAMRLPYGIQRDEADAQKALNFIRPDVIDVVDIKPAVDAMVAENHWGASDFVAGNVKARVRMIAQYMVAGTHNGLVIGTDHAAEALMGFYTKHGDGACDITPLAGLNKRQVRRAALFLGAPEELVFKVPTADLETDNPGLPDEKALGVTYDQIDDFLEGKNIPWDAFAKIVTQYSKTEHKRAMPYGPGDL